MFQFEFHGKLFQLEARDPENAALSRLPLNPLSPSFEMISPKSQEWSQTLQDARMQPRIVVWISP